MKITKILIPIFNDWESLEKLLSDINNNIKNIIFPFDLLALIDDPGLQGKASKIYANEGAAQFIFLNGNEKPETTYNQRNGKYMKQSGVTLPKV